MAKSPTEPEGHPHRQLIDALHLSTASSHCLRYTRVTTGKTRRPRRIAARPTTCWRSLGEQTSGDSSMTPLVNSTRPVFPNPQRRGKIENSEKQMHQNKTRLRRRFYGERSQPVPYPTLTIVYFLLAFRCHQMKQSREKRKTGVTHSIRSAIDASTRKCRKPSTVGPCVRMCRMQRRYSKGGGVRA